MNPKQVKVGDIVAFTFYTKVLTANFNGDSLRVHDIDGKEVFDVNGRYLVEKGYNADRFDESRDVSRAELLRVFVEAGDKPFTVNFEKADGTFRRLRGVLINSESLLGRSRVRDLDITEGSPMRQVDHRTINSLIVNNIQYVVKEK